jgi:hypothetical protein
VRAGCGNRRRWFENSDPEKLDLTQEIRYIADNTGTYFRRFAVITLELLRVIRDGQPCEAELAARVSANRDEISIDGPEPELVDGSQPALNLRDGTTITCADNPEEWVRGLAVSFRTPYLSAHVVEDTDPLPDVEIEPANVREPVFR